MNPVVKVCKRGEIYMADLDPVVGSEQGSRRPVLIIQNDVGKIWDADQFSQWN